MNRFGLERGLRDTGIQHEDAREYYKRVQKAQEVSEEMTVFKPKKTFLGLNSSKLEIDVDKPSKTIKAKIMRFLRV